MSNAIEDLKHDAETTALAQRLLTEVFRLGTGYPKVDVARAIMMVAYQVVHECAMDGMERMALQVAAEFLQRDPAEVIITG